MKKEMTQRSLEERAKFFKKNLHKVELSDTGSKTEKVEVEKSSSVHEIIQDAVSKEEPKKEEEELDLSLNLEEEE